MKQNTYTFVFAAIVCVICSVLLAAVAEGLRPRQELNEILDVKKNILKAVHLVAPLNPKAKPQEILDTFNKKIEEKIIDENGNFVEGMKISDIKPDDKLYPLYVYKENGETLAYCYPVVGQGLWSTLYGYLAMETDGLTIRGVTFYKHGETPGLGAEIEKDWFLDNFQGKKIWSDKNNALAPIVVVKGHVTDVYRDERAEHAVDGITAATLTGKGVTAMMDKWMNIYDPFFMKLRKS